MDLKHLAAFGLVCSFASVTWAASPGSLDTSFAVGLGSNYGDNVVMVQTNGQVLIAGDFNSYHSVTRLGVARLNTDASLDLTFDPTNNVAGGVRAGALLPDGRIVVAGVFTIGSAIRNRVARLNTDGTLDSSFDPGAGPNNDVRCLAVQADGKIVIGGRFTSEAGQTRKYLARLNTDGSLDTNFVAAADYFVDTLAIQPDGKILVGGWFFHLNGTSPPNLARLNADGTLDAAFTPGVNAPVETIAVQADGRIIIGGYSTFATGAQVSRLMPDGTWDSSFVPQVASSVNVVCVQNDGKILVGAGVLARLYSDGSTDASFSCGTGAARLAFEPDGRIVMVGGFAYVEGVLEQGVARLYGDDRTATPVIEINGKAFRAWQSDASINIPVLRSGNTNTTVSVQYATVDLDAQAGVDYMATSGTLIFVPGEVTKSVTVPLLNGGQVDDSKRFGFLLTNATDSVLGALTNATVTVLGVNNIVQISTPDIVTNELAGALSITLTRVGTNLASSVACQTVDGTAVGGINYSNLAQVVSFAPGQAVKTVSVTLLDDSLPGPDTFFSVVVLTNGVNGQIGARSTL